MHLSEDYLPLIFSILCNRSLQHLILCVLPYSTFDKDADHVVEAAKDKRRFKQRSTRRRDIKSASRHNMSRGGFRGGGDRGWRGEWLTCLFLHPNCLLSILGGGGRGGGRGGFQQRDMGPPDAVLGDVARSLLCVKCSDYLIRNGHVCSCS